MNIFYRVLVLAICFTVLACKKKDTLFHKIDPAHSGINFINQLDENSDLNILNYLYYYNGAGVGAGDYNNDGLVDLYFSANESADKLYLNKGSLKFKEVTAKAGINNKDGWTTGISNVDINGDGLLDLYISKVSGYRGLKGHNLLYLNLGTGKDGIPVFEEQSKKYGLDFSGFSTQAVFLDYDMDGDLDMFLLNHSVHPNRNYGKGGKREVFNEMSGDRIFENDNGFFKDVSHKTGIYQGIIGYGLGVAVGDVNNDFYPDIYVGNDFFENDYLYINQKNGSFKDLISTHPEKLGHTTHFSMGNDIADMNNDGLADILSLDMLPEDLKTYKTSGLEHPYQTYSNYLKNGFSPQYMQNTLHINSGDMNFSESAFLSGIAATEWSWGGLFADFDNDTRKDLFITNGIKGATNDMDFIQFISNEKIQKELSSGKAEDYRSLITELPEKKVNNYIFRNLGNNLFKEINEEWLDAEPSFSHGVVYADLDNDGDLDLAVNNMEEEAGIFENTSQSTENANAFLKVNLNGSKNNRFGIGARVIVFHGKETQMQEHYLSRGYLSSLSPGLHFGLGKNQKIDSIQVIWSPKLSETKYNLEMNSVVEFDIRNADTLSLEPNPEYFLTLIDSLIDHRHIEQSTLEFNREPLIPFGYANQSPRSSVGDINNDGYEDLIIGGGKSQPLTCWMQKVDGSFTKRNSEIFDENTISEDIDQLLIDIERDGDLDLIVVSGGNEFRKGKALQPRLYLNENGIFKKDNSQFRELSLNASRITSVDFNNDGYPDICFSSNIVPTNYGKTPTQYLYLNDGKGNFNDVTMQLGESFATSGNVQDIMWKDLNSDGFEDAIVVGHWMPVKIFINKNGKELIEGKTNLNESHGWWNTIEAGDFDKDGDIDLVAGNWGLNSRLTAKKAEPLRLYLNDFDGNGSLDPVVSYFYKGSETAFSSKDELDKQMPFLKKKFPNYRDYANADFSDVFPPEKLKNAELKQVYELASCYFENNGDNTFKKYILPFECQVSSIFDIEKYDFNHDGYEDLLFVGNNYEISTQLGRLDASHGTLLINDKKGFFDVYKKPIPDISGSSRNIQKILINGKDHFIITRNNSSPIILKSNNFKK